MTYILGLACIVHLTAFSQDIAQSILFSHEPWDYATESLYDNHVSSLEVINGDTLICAWFGGLKEGWPDMRLMISHSYDGGLNWAPGREFIRFEQDTSARDPQLIYHEGILHLIFTRQIGAGNSRTAADHALFYCQSSDLGLHWTNPDSLIFQGNSTNIRVLGPFNPPIKVDDEFIFGIHWYETGSSRTHAGILVANLDEASFQLRGDISPGYRLLEPVPQLAEDTLYQYYRTDQGFIYHNYSLDTGYTWTAPEPTALYNPDGLAYVAQWNADTTLVIWNDHFEKRDYLSVGLFTGRKLQHVVRKIVIDVIPSARGQVSYPSVVRQGELVRISYTYRQEERFPPGNVRRFGDIKYAQLSFSEPSFESFFPVTLGQIDIFQSLLWDAISIDDKLYICGNDKLFGWTKWNFGYFQPLELPNTANSYDFYTMALDTGQHSLNLGGRGGWYIEYDLEANQPSYEGILDTIGISTISDLHIEQDQKLIINQNGDLLAFPTTDDQPSFVINLDSIQLHAIQPKVEADREYLLVSDSAIVLHFQVDNLQSELLSQTTSWEAFRHIKYLGQQAWFLGEKGLIAKLDQEQVEFLDLGPNARFYNFIDVFSLAASQLVFITDKNKLWLYDLEKRYAEELSLPGTPHFMKALGSPTWGRSLLLCSVEGNIYQIDLDELAEYFTEVLVTNLPRNSLESGPDISLYPNPSSEVLHIAVDKMNPSTDLLYSIFSQQGKLVHFGTLQCCTDLISIDIALLPAGLYYFSYFDTSQNLRYSPVSFIKL